MNCYMCDSEATTTEHAPPRAFFPKGYRENLLTVPSCLKHNHSQSLDIEYTRNVIASIYGGNNQAEQAFEVAERSFDRSLGLFYQTFGEFETIVVDGQETGVFPFDLQRLKSVMKAMANAIYFRDYGHRCTADWKIFATSLKSREDLDGQVSQWEPFENFFKVSNLRRKQ